MGEIRIVAAVRFFESPYYAPMVCGVDIGEDGRVEEAAPILHYMLGWSRERVLDYCRRKGWEAEVRGG